MPMPLRTELINVATECTNALMQDFSISCKREASKPSTALIDNESAIGVIGFSGEKIKGTLTILTSKNFLSTSHPNLAMEMPVAASDVSDWAGEISNQLLGRIKNKMLEFDLPFSMSTPTVIIGNSMNQQAPVNGMFGELAFNTDKGDFWIKLSVVMAPDVTFAAKTGKNDASAKEGDSMLF